MVQQIFMSDNCSATAPELHESFRVEAVLNLQAPDLQEDTRLRAPCLITRFWN